MRKIILILLFLIGFLVTGCNSRSSKKNVETTPVNITAPRLLFPLNGAKLSGKFVVLEWESSGISGVKYNLYIGKGERDLHKVVSNLLFNSYTLMVSEGVTYYWRVDAIYGDKISSSEVAWFKVKKVSNRAPYPPQIVYPDGVTIDFDYLLLRWNPGVDPDGDKVSCKVYLGDTPTSLSPIKGKECNLVRQVGPLSDGTYWWKVEECDSHGLCVTSPISRFSVSVDQERRTDLSFYPVFPTDGSVIPGGDKIRLAWKPIDLNWDIAYSIYVSINGEGWRKVADGLRGDNYSYTPLQNDSEYRWKVVATLEEYGLTITSQESTFYTYSAAPSVKKQAVDIDLGGSDYGKEGVCIINNMGEIICRGYSDNGSIDYVNDAGRPVEPFSPDLPENNVFTSVSISSGLGCAISLSGYLYCWGKSLGTDIEYKELKLYKPVIERVPGVKRWSKVSAGYGPHVCAISSYGELYCWGNNDSGEIGKDPSKVSFAASPLKVTVSGGERWIDVATGGKFSCGIESGNGSSSIYCWGSEKNGALGNGVTTGVSYYPVRVSYTESVTNWVSLYAGKDFACGLSKSGELYCWGDNEADQLGMSSGKKIIPYAIKVNNPKGRPWRMVAAGFTYVCAKDDLSDLYCWGERDSKAGYGLGRFIGESPDIYTEGYSDTVTYPLLITTNAPWKKLKGSVGVSCGVDKIGHVYCSGYRVDNGIFDKSYISGHISHPQKIEVYDNQRWIDIATSRDNICGIDDRGILYCWGRNNGDLWSSYNQRIVPTPLFPKHRWVKVSRYNFYRDDRHYFRCAIDISGDLYCWGDFPVGGLYGSEPVMVPNPSGNRWIDVDGANLAVCAVDEAGNLYCWGHSCSDRSNLGLGAIDADFTEPQKLSLPNDVEIKEVSLGFYFGYALATNGDLYRWGDGDWGQTANYFSDVPTPKKYTSVSGPFNHLSCEYDTMCATKVNGELWCQGKRRIGDSYGGSSAPWQVGAGGDWMDLSSAENSSCAFDSNGNVMCWNDDVGLSQVDTEGYKIKRIFIEGNGIGCFINNSDSLYCWGDNSKDYLGASSALKPVKIDW